MKKFKNILAVFLVSGCAYSVASASLPSSGDALATWASQANLTSARVAMQNPFVRQVTVTTSNAVRVTPPIGVETLKNPQRYPLGAANFTCVKDAAYHHKVPLRFMLAINSIEQGRVAQYVGNTNGSKDIGQFQINTIHLPRFAKYGATKDDLANRGCYNAQAAARLLSIALNEPSKRHLDIFTRAAGYHSWTPKYNKIYRTKLIRYLKEWDVWLRVNNLDSSPLMVSQ